MVSKATELNPSQRILMGPGPSDVDPRVLRAMSTPLVGHLDPDFLDIMNQTQAMLRFVMQTENPFTIAVSGTGSAGMETALCNVIEPGDEAVVCVAGVFGERMSDIVERCRGTLTRVEAEWGRVVEPDQVAGALKGKSVKVVCIVHAETSTGAHQPLEEISRIVHDNGALLLVDAVTSLGGTKVALDEWGVDVCYSGTQKCLSCPPGLAPVSFNARAMEVVAGRKTKVQSWYLDMNMVQRYWGDERAYHHTAPISMIYALFESLRIIQEEGLQARFARHRLNHEALAAGLAAMGIGYVPPEGYRLPMLNAVAIPEGVNDATVRGRLLNEFGIEIGGGLGQFAGKAWRIGLMGHSSRKRNVILLLAALECLLQAEGVSLEPGAALRAAEGVYGKAASTD